MKRVRERNTTRIIFHILVWAVLIGLPIYSAKRVQMGSNFIISYYAIIIINAIIFYTNYLILVPRLFFQKKRYRYFIAVPALLICFYFISDAANKHVSGILSSNDSSVRFYREPGEGGATGIMPLRRQRPRIVIGLPNAHTVGYMSSTLFMIFLSLGLRVLERQAKIEKMQEEMEKSRLSAELAFLKNQISPHFFFNTLNNIYSLIGRNNEDSRNAVIKLSKLMRYILNESQQDFKTLSDEIEFMNNYIDLMKLRIGSKTRLDINFPAEHMNPLVPHLLFVSLIENAFKYGISVQEESFVKISLGIKGNNILFSCENGLPESNSGNPVESSGIGLENLRKRLNLIYPGRHELEIRKTRERFEVNLTIQL